MDTTMTGTAGTGRTVEPQSSDDGPERGSVTAEYAVLLPVIVLCLALILGASSVGIERVRAEEATRTAARMIARGDSPEQAASAARKVFGADLNVSTSAEGEFVQVSVSAASTVPILGWVLPTHHVTAVTVAEHHD